MVQGRGGEWIGVKRDGWIGVNRVDHPVMWINRTCMANEDHKKDQ